MEFAPSVSL
ncbi:hypothetical protein E2C01_083016 [Portunus trituberculatus]|uniref:Uncharacterized protein n=1 Tax=Portunus trituberculatus TaxID=210409 RepID=A0A5B7J0T5_PORTR|nr:hypothetical protein [Portunus trituberculatus]